MRCDGNVRTAYCSRLQVKFEAGGIIPMIKKGRQGDCCYLKLNEIRHFGMAYVEDRLIGSNREVCGEMKPSEAKRSKS